MIIDYRLLGKRLASIRKEQKITQERLAEMTDLANNYISNIETGRSIPSLETLVKLCESLKITPNDLLLGTVQTAEDYQAHETLADYAKCTARERRMVQQFITLLLNERDT